MTLCAGLLVRGRWGWMCVALAIATLNRETSIMLGAVVVCWVYAGRSSWPKVVGAGAVIFVTWAVAYYVARQIAGVGSEWILSPENPGQGGGLMAEVAGTFFGTWPRRAESMMSLVRNPHPYNV